MLQATRTLLRHAGHALVQVGHASLGARREVLECNVGRILGLRLANLLDQLHHPSDAAAQTTRGMQRAQCPNKQREGVAPAEGVGLARGRRVRGGHMQ
jgi:hypothetical protein